MVLVDQFADDAVDLYADALSEVARALAVQDVASAKGSLAPISNELWHGSVPVTSSAAPDLLGTKRQTVPGQTRADVFRRDRFRCSLCGRRGLPLCVMVAISDVFPDLFAYHANYGKGRIHPAYWVLALEADHTLPYARGGPGHEGNLTAMHALCNMRKWAADFDEVVGVAQIEDARDWDGLISAYPGVVLAGNTRGRRHSVLGYHARWLRWLQLTQLGHEADPAASRSPVANPSTSTGL